MDIGERIVVHRLLEVDGVENLDAVLVPHQDGPALLDDPPFRMSFVKIEKGNTQGI